MTTAQALTYGEWVRAFASLGLGFEAGLWNASMISVAPVPGLVLENTINTQRQSLPESEASSRLNTWTVGIAPARPHGFGWDGATRKAARTSVCVF